ncbi:glycosyltransferase [Chryseobacterium foetidum]|uniref:glycosyltransferase n=1 Tax=Chryseobacterium foetidum TaxID=2951057 RepID=UPI0021C9812A|nr:glycosyltransferase [Chryseobacterium foetidum]
MKFSVIIPVYNLEGYITRCLESFTQQNYDVNDFELLIVNDGSTDGSLEIIENFKERFPHHQITVFTKSNGGLSSARNYGISKARGNYIWFVDGDDWVPEMSLTKLSDHLNRLPSLDILEFDYELAFETEKSLEFKYAGNPNAKSTAVETGREFLEDHEYSLGVTIKIFRREFLLQNNSLFPVGMFSEDNIFSLKTTLLAERYYKINEVYYFYYQRQNSITKTKTTEHLKKYYEDIFQNMQEMRKVVREESSAIQKTIAGMNSFFVLLMMLDLFKNKKYNLIKHFAKKIKQNNFYPLEKVQVDYISKKKFSVLRIIINLYLKFV